MKKNKTPLFLSALLLLAFAGNAQQSSPNWMEQLSTPKANFFDIQKNFYANPANSALTGTGESEEEDANGAELFKRFEYFAEPRVYPSGDLSLLGRTHEEFQKYMEQIPARIAQSQYTQSTWTYFCPSGIPQGAGAGRVNCIAVDPNSTSTLWLGTADGGLWKSTNGGNTWATTTDLFTSLGVSDIVFDPANHLIMYVVTGDKDGFHTGSPHAFSFGVQKSTDGGLTWTTLYPLSITSKPMISRFLIDPSNSQNMYVSGNFGISRSTDGGTTWSTPFTGAGSVMSMEFKPGTPGTLYASGKYFYRSVDNGVTWTNISSGLPTSGTYRESIGVTAANGAYVYVLAADSVNTALLGVYQSTDGGTTFTKKTGTSPNLLGFSQTGSDAGKGQGFYTLSIGVSPTNASELMVGGVNIWKSTNGGTSFGSSAVTYWASNHTSSNYVHADIHHILYQDGTTVLVGCDGGIFKSTSGGTSWTDICSNLQISQLYGLGMSTTNPAKVLSGWQDNGTNLMTSKTSWQYALGGDGMKCFIDYSNDNIMYGEQYNGNFNISTNGTSWSNLGPPSSEKTAWATPWKQDPKVSNTIYGGQVNLYKSTNQGSSWTMIGTQPDATNTITEFAIAPSNTQVIYVVKKTGVTKTTNGGTSWTTLTGLPTSSAPTYVAVNATNPNIVYVTFSGYVSGSKVFASGDGGATWTNYSTGLPNLPANCITYAKNSKGAVYVGMDVGVYFRDSTFSSWQPYITGLPDAIVTQMEIYYPTQMLRAATFGRGIWEIPLYVPGVMTSVQNISKAGELNIYPNPSSGLVEIDFTSETNDSYVLNTYNIIGKQIESKKITAVAGETFHNSLDLSAFGKGVYLVSLSGPSGVTTKRLIVN
ncbi:MAG TPA: T9SS type A sorting domain-containing protein [Bacteroidia bacterium]|jgi:hypothetical protein|nr:T9SS type A sorting domain-containing protein [Bacteroidia bacterium]